MAETRDLIGGLDLNPPATEEEICACMESLPGELPAGYVAFLRMANGGDGFVGENAYVILWKCGELAEMNEAYEVKDYAPGLLLFGSDGGGEAFGFDTRDADWPIVQVPFIGMGWRYAKPCGKSFAGFLEWLGQVD